MEREQDGQPRLGAVEMPTSGHLDAVENAEACVAERGCTTAMSFF
jgi:dissimilatory sulfite reductase (desulfoviridin) alpha/beta subunit